MTIGDRFNIDATTERWLVRAMQAILVLICLYALIVGEWTVVINAGVALVATFLPALLQRDYHIPMDVGLTLWITTAVFLHAIGALGPYDWFGWYDSVTHTLSGTLVAGIGYASARALDEYYDDLTIPPQYMFAFIVIFSLAVGVLWEMLEFTLGGIASLTGTTAVLAQRGSSDIVFDILYDGVGGIIVAGLGTQQLKGVASALANRIGTQTSG